LACGAYEANAYLVSKEGSGECALIDAGDDFEKLDALIAASGKTIRAILLTHAHFDHILAAEPLSKKWSVPVYLHGADAEMLCDDAKNARPQAPYIHLPSPKELRTTPYGDALSVGGMEFRVLRTPGHTKGGVCLYCAAEKVMFTGDTLFADGFGRMDLYGGSQRAMLDSLKMLFAMDGGIRVYPGHGEASTIAEIRGRYY